jgi:hypothetical protein
VQPAFKVAEQDGNSFDPALIRKILQALFLNDVGGNALLALLFRLQVQILEFIVRMLQKIT